MTESHVDLLVIGGGINGAGIAADAAGRGLSTLLCEQNDLASGTSSYSSKLIHGGIRYLNQYDFKLVRNALQEREILMKKAPFLIRPLKFVLPYAKHLRPGWMIRIGLFLYDHLAKRQTIPDSGSIPRFDPQQSPLNNTYKKGFFYYDCTTDDARLVVLNTLAAKQKGATVLTRCKCIKAEREGTDWLCQLKKNNGELISVTAKAVVDATGPWINQTLADITPSHTTSATRNVKGSHIIIKKLYLENHAYILQNADKRVIFTIPYQNDYTLVGTTDVLFKNDPETARIDNDEIEYLCESVNSYFKKSITRDDILYDFSGVRPLYDDHHKDPSKITRDAHIEIETENNLPIVNVFGGKLTTYRELAETVLEKLKPYFPNMGPAWTATAPLPGGDLDNKTWSEFLNAVKQQYAWLPESLIERYAASYGSRIHQLLQNKNQITDLGECFGGDLYAAEVNFLCEEEWAITAEDILWRRSKLILKLTAAKQHNLQQYLAARESATS